jgi:hypothetical protein
MFAQFVIGSLSMVLLFDAYTDHNAITSPAPRGGKYLSTDKEVKFGNKSESDIFQENQNVLIHFCMNQHEDIAWKFFGNKTRNQIGWPCKKIDIRVWSSSVQYVKQFTTDSGIISSHQHYVDSYSRDKGKEAMWIHYFVILQLFHPKYQKVQEIHFVHDIHSLIVCHFNHNEDQEHTNLFEDTPRYECLWWVRRFSFIECSEVTT